MGTEEGRLPLHVVLHLSVLGCILFPCVSPMQRPTSGRGEVAAIGANKLLQLRGGGPLNPNHRMEADVDIADMMDGLNPGARQSAIDELKGYQAPKEVWKSEDDWLAEDDPETGQMGVTPEVRLAFDRAMAAFEAEMEAEGRHNWREELRAAGPPTITPIMTEDPEQVDGEDAKDEEGGQHFDEVEQAWQEVRNETLRATLGTDDARTMELRRQVEKMGEFQELLESGITGGEGGEEEEKMWREKISGLAEKSAKDAAFLDTMHERVHKELGGYTMMKACRDGNTTALRQGLEAGMDPDFPDLTFANWTCLHWASLGGKLQSIKLLWEEGGCSIDPVSEIGQTPLHVAAMAGQAQAVSLLRAYGADIDAQDSKGRTALHYVSQSDARRFCQHLVSLGASTDLKDWAGNTPLDIAGPNAKLALAGGRDGAGEVLPDYDSTRVKRSEEEEEEEEEEKGGKGGAAEDSEEVADDGVVLAEG